MKKATELGDFYRDSPIAIAGQKNLLDLPDSPRLGLGVVTPIRVEVQLGGE